MKRRYWLVLGVAVSGFVAGLALRNYYLGQCPEPCVDLKRLTAYDPFQTSVVYDRNGEAVGRFFVQDREVAPLSSIPLHVRQAFLAVEDTRFYQHHGIDLFRFFRAILSTLGGRPQGGSTITMQLARNIYPELLPARERTVDRKLREMVVAQKIERTLPKDSILQHYLNTIYLGRGSYGVAAAARRYFGKAIQDVSVQEAAILASLAQAPSTVNPVNAPAASRARRDLVLDRMYANHWLSRTEWTAVRKSDVRLVTPPSEESGGLAATTGDYFIEEVRQELQARFGGLLYRGGLRIYTTLDAGQERLAENVLETEMQRLEQLPGNRGPSPRRLLGQDDSVRASDYLQAGLVVIDSDSGDVRVLIGGRSFRDSPFNRMTQAWRQPGSVFKTFVYAAAFEDGWTDADMISDEPISVAMPGGLVWRPENYVKTEHNGRVSLRSALTRSLNRATVRLGLQLGVSRVLETAYKMGMAGPIAVRPATLLGAVEVQPMGLIASFSPISRADGQRVKPRLVTRVETPRGEIIYLEQPSIQPALRPSVSAELRRVLADVVDHGTARSVRTSGYTGQVVGKTGTTNGTTNAWFVGATPDAVSGIWIGYDLPRPILPDTTATGGKIAAPIWAEIMQRLPRHRSVWPEEIPSDSIPVPVEASNKIAPGTPRVPAVTVAPAQDTVKRFKADTGVQTPRVASGGTKVSGTKTLGAKTLGAKTDSVAVTKSRAHPSLKSRAGAKAKGVALKRGGRARPKKVRAG